MVVGVNLGPSYIEDVLALGNPVSEAEVAEYRLLQPSLPRIELVRDGEMDLTGSAGGLIVVSAVIEVSFAIPASLNRPPKAPGDACSSA